MKKLFTIIFVLISYLGTSQTVRHFGDVLIKKGADTLLFDLDYHADTIKIISTEPVLFPNLLNVNAAAGGNTTEVQFNSSGVLAGDSDFTFNNDTLLLNGVLGIGTTSSEEILNAVSTGNTKALFTSNGDGFPQYAIKRINGSSYENREWTTFLQSNGFLIIKDNTDGVDAITIDTNQNVGIGTSTPDYTLQVNGDIVSETDGTDNLGSNTIDFDTAFVDHGIFNTDVGIGTDNPTQALQVVGSNVHFKSTNNEARHIFASGTAATASSYTMKDGGSVNKIVLHTGANSYILNDNFGLGMDSPDYKLQVDGDIVSETDGTDNLGSYTIDFDTAFVQTIEMNELNNSSSINFDIGGSNKLTFDDAWFGSIVSGAPILKHNSDGSYTAPSYTFANRTTTGFSSEDADMMSIIAGSWEAMRIVEGTIDFIRFNGDFIPGTTNTYNIGSITGADLIVDTVYARAFSNGTSLVGGLNINATSQSIWSNTTNTYAVGEDGGTDNIVLGQNAGNDLTTGDYNILQGLNAGQKITTENNNIFIGDNAGKESNGADDNIFIGKSAGYNVDGDRNILLGGTSGWDNVGGDYNVNIGYGAGYYADGADGSVFIGYQAGAGTTGNEVTGNNNVAIGYQSGNALQTTATGNVFLGALSGSLLTSASNQLYITNSNDATPLIYGDFAADSVVINGKLNSDLWYGQLYTADGSVTVSSTPINTYTTITGFEIDGGSSNTTLTDSSITIAAGGYGLYHIGYTTSFIHSGSTLDCHASLFVDDVEDTRIEAERTIGTGADVGSMGSSAYILLYGGEVLKIKFKADETGTATMNHMSFFATKM